MNKLQTEQTNNFYCFESGEPALFIKSLPKCVIFACLKIKSTS